MLLNEGEVVFQQDLVATKQLVVLGIQTVSRVLAVPLLMVNLLALTLMNVLKKVPAMVYPGQNVLTSLVLTSMFCFH